MSRQNRYWYRSRGLTRKVFSVLQARMEKQNCKPLFGETGRHQRSKWWATCGDWHRKQAMQKETLSGIWPCHCIKFLALNLALPAKLTYSLLYSSVNMQSMRMPCREREERNGTVSNIAQNVMMDASSRGFLEQAGIGQFSSVSTRRQMVSWALGRPRQQNF